MLGIVNVCTTQYYTDWQSAQFVRTYSYLHYISTSILNAVKLLVKFTRHEHEVYVHMYVNVM